MWCKGTTLGNKMYFVFLLIRQIYSSQTYLLLNWTKNPPVWIEFSYPINLNVSQSLALLNTYVEVFWSNNFRLLRLQADAEICNTTTSWWLQRVLCNWPSFTKKNKSLYTDNKNSSSEKWRINTNEPTSTLNNYRVTHPLFCTLPIST